MKVYRSLLLLALSKRSFATTMRASSVARAPSSSFLDDDDFLPELEKKEIDYQ